MNGADSPHVMPMYSTRVAPAVAALMEASPSRQLSSGALQEQHRT
jgi:hypothetical protein